MSTEHKSPLTNYINWLFKQYQELKKIQGSDAIYRLVDIKEKDESYILTVQIVGKATTFTMSPEDILSNDALIENFTSKDIRTITYYATKTLVKPKNKIVIKRFCEKLNQIVYGVKHIEQDSITEKTAAEISLDKALLNNLTPEEAHMVGYTTSQEIQEKERLHLEQLRKDKS